MGRKFDDLREEQAVSDNERCGVYFHIFISLDGRVGDDVPRIETILPEMLVSIGPSRATQPSYF